MNVLHLSTNGRKGGAGRAAWRLHTELADLGVRSRMLTLDTGDTAPGLLHLKLPAAGGDDRAASFRELFVNSNRTELSNTWFGAELEGFDVTSHPAIREADILHLHWVSGLVSSPHIGHLLATGKPVVWTLHDQAPFTGGCHYAAGCNGYLRDCRSCPQLRSFADVLAAAQLSDKLALWQGGRLGVIALNSWMADAAGRAPALAGRPVGIIPNGINLDRFHPRLRAAQRKQLRIPDDAMVFLYAAESSAETRKGSAVLTDALEILGRSAPIRKAAYDGRLVFLAAGHGVFPDRGLPVRSLGWCKEEQMAKYYAAADAFLLPSKEDNLPNTVLEALAAGTPAIGFAVGGVPEMIIDGKTGRLVGRCDAEAFANTLTEVIASPGTLAAMRTHCRAFAEEHYDGPKNARRVLEFYRELVATKPGIAAKAPVSFPGPALAAFLDTPRPETMGRPPGALLIPHRNGRLEAEFDARLKELKDLYVTAEAFKNERNLLKAQLADLQRNFAATEADRLTRGKVIEKQGAELTAVHAEFDARLKELKELYAKAEGFKNDRNLLQAQLADLQKNFAAAETDRLTRGKVIEKQGAEIAALHTEFDRRLKELKELYATAETLKNERNLLSAQLADLQKNFAAAEADRVARGEVIEQQGKRTTELERLVWLTEQDRDYWKNVAQRPPA